MKNKFFITIPILCLISFLAAGCVTPVKVAGSYTYKTECLGKDPDGTQILKAWGSGKKRSQAVETAMKNAVNDVLFKGIREGNAGCEVKPIIPEVNAREKYASFFNDFFAEDGEYLNFVEKRDRKIKQGDLKQSRNGLTAGIILKIHMAELKKRMFDEGIINY